MPGAGLADPGLFLSARAFSLSSSTCSIVRHVTIVRCDPVGVSRLQIFFVLGDWVNSSVALSCGSGCDLPVSLVAAQLVISSR